MENELETNPQDHQNHPPQNHKFRFGLLIVLVTSSLLILGRSLIDGNIGQPTPFMFPEQIDLKQDSIKISVSQTSENINDAKEFHKRPKFLFGRHYQYLFDDILIDIDLRYVIGTEGQILEILSNLRDIKPSEQELEKNLVRKAPIGYYLTFTHQNRAYLTACINPRGISTVTQEQFNDNASDHAMDRDVIISWLLGQRDLRDRRCLWTLMSTPITTNSDLNATNQKLEKMWISWYEWWKPRFPEP
jgi:cyanosortase A-associated protein